MSLVKYSQCLHSLLDMGRFYVRSKFLRIIFSCNTYNNQGVIYV